jgi:hypothetical protein
MGELAVQPFDESDGSDGSGRSDGADGSGGFDGAGGEGASPALHALAQALTDLFQGLGISQRRYAARRSYDSSTVSRYLNGQRLPRWEFVRDLLNDVGEVHGAVPTPEAITMLRSLHDTALNAAKGAEHRVRSLERQLRDADAKARETAARERMLAAALRDREENIRDLQTQNRELRAQIGQLREELERVRELNRRAEERCDELEEQLVAAEMRLAPPSTLVPTAPRPSPGFRGRAVIHHPTAGPGSATGTGTGTGTGAEPGAWQVDESFVDSVTVQVMRGRQFVGNGLLIDPTTVVTTATVVWHFAAMEGELRVVWEDRSAEAEVIECLPSDPGTGSDLVGGTEPYPNLSVLRLASPVTAAVPYYDRGWQPRIGSQLLVSAHGAAELEGPGAYSCLLVVKGRAGNWVRVEGDLIKGLRGAPAFHTETRSLAGLVRVINRENSGGSIIPAAALRELTTLTRTA